jgi:bile acid:Na+ symporter, BASS family
VEFLSKVIPVTLLIFVVSSMLAVGLSLTVGEILLPLRNRRLVSLALLANFVVMPLAAFVIARLLRLDEPLAAALLLLGTAAGAPFLPKLAGVAKGSLAFAVGLMVMLMALTVGYMPLVLPLLLEGVSVDPSKIARSLVLLMLIPLAAGLAVKSRFKAVAARVAPLLNRLSTLSLALLIVLLLATNVQNIIDLFGTRGILASILFLLVSFGTGWLLGGPGLDTRGVLALGTAQRNIAAALVVGGQNFSDPKVVVMVAVVAIVGLLVLMPLARVVARRSEQP